MQELRGYVAARGWATSVEFTDIGVSGAKSRRPALDRLMLAARRRQIDAVVCWRLDRLGRGLAHLLTVVNEWTALGVAFISLGEGIDATTPAGAPPGLTVRQAAALWSCSRSTAARRLAKGDLPTVGKPPRRPIRKRPDFRFSPDQAVRRTGVCPGHPPS